MYCRFCGNQVPDDSVYCPHCGSRLVEVNRQSVQNDHAAQKSETDGRKGWLYLLLAILFGHLGVHRFYVSDITGGVIYILATIILGASMPTEPLVGALVVWIAALVDGAIHASDKALMKRFGKHWR